jgi:hypothetical protein
MLCPTSFASIELLAPTDGREYTRIPMKPTAMQLQAALAEICMSQSKTGIRNYFILPDRRGILLMSAGQLD